MEAPQLNIQDLEAVVKIIDACSERGAFKGNEMASVGAVRERINEFAIANKPEPVAEPQENDNEKDDGIDYDESNPIVIDSDSKD
jgi:hypothetical protein|tara:strand:+ start:247 stop:501 length:255 start_codon:yes stop_codon:yes gene_type:complete